MIESPCIGVCTVVDNKCIGCTRTSDEISSWLFYTDFERQIITKRCFKDMRNNKKNNTNPKNI